MIILSWGEIKEDSGVEKKTGGRGVKIRPWSLLDPALRRYRLVFTIGKGINISSQIEL